MLGLLELDFELANLLPSRLARGKKMRRILALPFDARDFIAGGILFALQTFDLGNEPAPPRLERCELLEIGIRIEPAVAIAARAPDRGDRAPKPGQSWVRS